MIYNLPNITYDSRSRVPEGYTELHWIESSGTQYIDSGVTTDNLRVELDMEYTSTSTNQYGGAGNVNYNRYNIPMLVSSSVLRVNMGDETALASITPDTNRHTFMLDSYQRKGGIDSSESSYSGSFSASSYNFYVLARNTGSAGNFISGRVYGLKMWKSGVSVRDYVPCINPQGEVGMYDTVSETFFGNSGSGVFIAGARVVQLPSGYTQLEYIQSTGTQYMQIEKTLRASSDSITVNMAFEMVEWTNSFPVFFYWKGVVTSFRLYMYSGLGWGTNFYWHNSYTGSYSTGVKYAVKFYKEQNASSGTITINGTQYFNKAFDDTPADITTLQLLWQDGVNKAKAKVYGFNATVGADAVIDLIPCLNPSNEVGMYDLVSQSFFGNSGSGNFTAGEVV